MADPDVFQEMLNLYDQPMAPQPDWTTPFDLIKQVERVAQDQRYEQRRRQQPGRRMPWEDPPPADPTQLEGGALESIYPMATTAVAGGLGGNMLKMLLSLLRRPAVGSLGRRASWPSPKPRPAETLRPGLKGLPEGRVVEQQGARIPGSEQDPSRSGGFNITEGDLPTSSPSMPTPRQPGPRMTIEELLRAERQRGHAMRFGEHPMRGSSPIAPPWWESPAWRGIYR
jgi:hypothetical protein